MSKTEEVLATFKKIDKEVTDLKTLFSQEEYKLNIKKETSKEILTELQESGISFKNTAEIEQKRTELTDSLQTSLGAVARNIEQVKQMFK